MNLEEAIANIGKEVTYIGNDKELIDDVFKDKKLIISEPTKRMATNVLIEYDELCFWNIDPRHLKLKEQPMQNYKIKVTPETSEEVQELFFELGGKWTTFGSNVKHVHGDLKLSKIYFSNGVISGGWSERNFENGVEQEITLPQLRDLVVLKRNDVGDATHEHIRSGNKYYRGFEDYCFSGIEWVLTDITFPNSLKPINKEMTWQDALRAVADGKEVVFNNGFVSSDMSSYLKGHFLNCSFSLKPQTIYIDGGDYTKEELLKIVGEME